MQMQVIFCLHPRPPIPNKRWRSSCRRDGINRIWTSGAARALKRLCIPRNGFLSPSCRSGQQQQKKKRRPINNSHGPIFACDLEEQVWHTKKHPNTVQNLLALGTKTDVQMQCVSCPKWQMRTFKLHKPCFHWSRRAAHNSARRRQAGPTESLRSTMDEQFCIKFLHLSTFCWMERLEWQNYFTRNKISRDSDFAV